MRDHGRRNNHGARQGRKQGHGGATTTEGMATTLYNKEGGGVAAAAHQGGRRSGQGADGEFEQGAVERSRSGQRCKWRGEAPRGKEVEVACGARDAECLFQLFLIFLLAFRRFKSWMVPKMRNSWKDVSTFSF
jgi:hypothetical protein